MSVPTWAKTKPRQRMANTLTLRFPEAHACPRGDPTSVNVRAQVKMADAIGKIVGVPSPRGSPQEIPGPSSPPPEGSTLRVSGFLQILKDLENTAILQV